MPFRRKRKRSFKRRRRGRKTYNKRGRRGNFGGPRYLKYYGPGGRNPGTLPENFQVKLVYSEYHVVSSSNTFASELYEPSNFTSPRSGDSQSYKLFDQLLNLWQIFVPMAYKMSVMACNENEDQVMVGIYMSTTGTVAGDIDTALQQTRVKYIILSGKNGGRNQGTVSLYRSQKEIAGVNPLLEEAYWSINGALPDRHTRINVFYKNMFQQAVISVPIVTSLITYTRMMSRDLTPVAVESAVATAAELAGIVPPTVIISPLDDEKMMELN